MADRYYVNFPLTPGPVVLQGAEAHHLATVLRTKPGDAVHLFNGDGAEYTATVMEISKRSVAVEVGPAERPSRELPFSLEVAVPLPKGDRGDFLIEKLTELGVSRFVPLRTRRSVVHPRLERLERAVIEASKQCGRNRLMEVGPVTPWEEFCRTSHAEGLRLMAHPGGPMVGLAALDPPYGAVGWVERSEAHLSTNIGLAVGPEGGFTDDEIDLARSAGWQVVSLGRRILRVETAAIALAAYFAFSA